MDGPMSGFRHHPIWLLLVVLLVAVQTWLTLDFFHSTQSLSPLTSDEPVIAGRHPLRLYHADLGATHRQERGSTTCFDPAYQAGYLKTPGFDQGARFGELAVTLFGRASSAQGYKFGLVIASVSLPIFLVLGARGFGLSPGLSCLSASLGILLCWSGPARTMLLEGDVQLLLLGVVAMCHLGAQVRFARWAGLDSWLLMTLTCIAGWFLDPLGWCLVVATAIGYYLWMAWRQELTWHLSWWASGTIGLLANALWLRDWLLFAWLNPPLGDDPFTLSSPVEFSSFVTTLEAQFHDWPALIVIAGLALPGMMLMCRQRHVAAGTLAGLGMFVPVVVDPEASLAILGWFALCPTVTLLGWVPSRLLAVVVLGTLVLITGGLLQVTGPKPRIGLDDRELAIVATLRATAHEEDSPNARILWEEPGPGEDPEPFSALLATLTQHPYLGGLAPDEDSPYLFARLQSGRLTDSPIDTWSDEDLTRFFRRYNVGWVVCRSDTSIGRMRAYPWAEERPFPETVPEYHLFELTGPRSFWLVGSGRIEQADQLHVALKDVVPNADGEVVLSLHYRPEMQVTPAYVEVSPEVSPFHRHDPMPFVRLRLPGPVPRLVITWEAP